MVDKVRELKFAKERAVDKVWRERAVDKVWGVEGGG